MDCKLTSPMGFWGNEAEEVLAHRFPLHKACRDGDPVTLSRLVAEFPYDQLVLEDPFYSWTPIHWAAYFGKDDCLNGLLRCGVNVNVQTSKFQQTPAHVAAFGGHSSSIEMLIKGGADFHAKDYLGEIPLHKAARVGNSKCLEALIRSGTHVNMCNNNGLTAAQLARNQRFSECMRILEEVHQQQLSLKLHENGSNGHSFANGVSGSHVTNGNGLNGSQHPVFGRKRSFDDVSIPLIKRPRVGSCPFNPPSDGTMSSIRHPFHKPFPRNLPDLMDSESVMEEVDVPSRNLSDKETHYAGNFYSQYLLERQMEMFHGV